MSRIFATTLALSALLTACGVKEDTLHQRLAPVERQAEELQADQQELLQRLAASEAEMQRLRDELDALRPQPKGKKDKTATAPKQVAASVTPSGLAVPPPKIVTPAEAAAEDRRLQTTSSTPVAPVAPVAPGTSAVSGAPGVSGTSGAPGAVSTTSTATPTTGPIASGTLSVSAPTTGSATSPTTKPSAGQPAVQNPRPASEQESYRQALATYEKGRFAEAEQLFDRYLQTWPSGKLAPNALYWKGECLYSKGRNADAVFVFKDVLTRFPKHPKAPDALLKSIMSFKHLGDADNARLHFTVLQEDYPASSALKRAKELGLDR